MILPFDHVAARGGSLASRVIVPLPCGKPCSTSTQPCEGASPSEAMISRATSSAALPSTSTRVSGSSGGSPWVAPRLLDGESYTLRELLVVLGVAARIAVISLGERSERGVLREMGNHSVRCPTSPPCPALQASEGALASWLLLGAFAYTTLSGRWTEDGAAVRACDRCDSAISPAAQALPHAGHENE